MKLVLLEKVYDYRSVPLHATNGSGGQGAVGKGWGWGSVPWLVCVRFPSQVLKCPSQAVYTCTQPNIQDPFDGEQCTVSGGLRTCAIKEGARPALLSSSDTLGVYICMG